MPTQFQMLSRVLVLLLCVTLTGFFLAGCKRGDKGPILEQTDDSDRRGAESDSGDPGMSSDLALEDLLFSRDRGLKTVYFDFDSSALTPAALEILRQNAEMIKQVPNVIIQIAGHCDERGTQEYNLALGERRAQSVREHLRQLGISGDRMITISFGEEQPEVLGSNEAAWARNRRAEFLRAQSM
jgi:peptidoglycan-associated lipoprotein